MHLPEPVHLCTMPSMATKKAKSKLVVKASVKPEIRDFIRRSVAVCDRLDISHFTLSKKLFNEQARALENLAAGRGANVVGYLDAMDKLAEIEATAKTKRPDAQAVSA